MRCSPFSFHERDDKALRTRDEDENVTLLLTSSAHDAEAGGGESIEKTLVLLFRSMGGFAGLFLGK